MLREDQYRLARRLADHTAQKLKACQPRQVDIQNDKGEGAARNRLQRRLAGGHFRHLDIAAFIQQAANAGTDYGVILHHQNPFHVTIHSWASGSTPDTRMPLSDWCMTKWPFSAWIRSRIPTSPACPGPVLVVRPHLIPPPSS